MAKDNKFKQGNHIREDQQTHRLGYWGRVVINNHTSSPTAPSTLNWEPTKKNKYESRYKIKHRRKIETRYEQHVIFSAMHKFVEVLEGQYIIVFPSRFSTETETS